MLSSTELRDAKFRIQYTIYTYAELHASLSELRRVLNEEIPVKN
jgi:hypothetical protein